MQESILCAGASLGPILTRLGCMQTVKIGSDHADLLLHTGVDGPAARMGHSLVIDVADFRGTVDFDGDVPTALKLVAVVESIQVLSGSGTIKPLSDSDRVTITRNALKSLTASKNPMIVFESTAIEPSADGYGVAGKLTIAGVTKVFTVPIEVEDEGDHWSVRASATVIQSDFGIKPYATMLGALKVADAVEVDFVASIRR